MADTIINVWNQDVIDKANEIANRNRDIVRLRRMGLTLHEIGELKNMTHENVRHILQVAEDSGIDVKRGKRELSRLSAPPAAEVEQ
jgi:predicted transcriptional regulator